MSKHRVIQVASIEEALEIIVPNKAPFSGAASRDDSEYKQTWTGGSTWKSAVDMLQNGWPAGTAAVRNQIAIDFGNYRPREGGFETYNDVAGAYPDVAQFCAHEPEYMIDFRPHEEGKRIASIAVSISAAWSIDVYKIRKRGAALCVLVDSLESAGIRTEIDAIQSIRSGGNHQDVIIPVKYADQHLDMDRLAFMLSHPAMLRRIVFAIEEVQPDREDFNVAPSGSYGVPCDIHQSLLQDYDLYIPEISKGPDFSDPKAALGKLLEELVAKNTITSDVAANVGV